MQRNLSPFRDGEIVLDEAVIIDGVPHFTKQAIGAWLEYSDPRVAINIVVDRNRYIEEFSVDVKLISTDGKNYDSTVYSPVGFLLIVMESGQPRAQAMKVQVAHFVWQYAGPRSITAKEELELVKLQRTITNDLARTRDQFAREVLVDRLGRICRQLGQAMPRLELLGQDVKQRALPGV